MCACFQQILGVYCLACAIWCVYDSYLWLHVWVDGQLTPTLHIMIVQEYFFNFRNMEPLNRDTVLTMKGTTEEGQNTMMMDALNCLPSSIFTHKHIKCVTVPFWSMKGPIFPFPIQKLILQFRHQPHPLFAPKMLAGLFPFTHHWVKTPENTAPRRRLLSSLTQYTYF